MSGWRNSRLKAIVSTPKGSRALWEWVNIWVSGAVPEIMAYCWRTVLGVPLRKTEIDVRPILIGEALLSVPGACLNHVVNAKVGEILGRTQFGIGVPAGLETMVGITNVLASYVRTIFSHRLMSLMLLEKYLERRLCEMY